MSELAVTINGEPRRVPGPATLLELLAHLGLDPRTVVVELNREIVRRPRLGETVRGGRRRDRAGAFRRRGVRRESVIFPGIGVIPSAARDLAHDRRTRTCLGTGSARSLAALGMTGKRQHFRSHHDRHTHPRDRPPRHPRRRPADHRRPELPLAAHGRHRQVPQQRRHGARHRGFGRRDRHGGRAPGGSRPDARRRACSIT